MRELSQKELFEFSREQFNEIAYGAEKGVDYTIYADKRYTPEQMHQLLEGLMQQLDVTPYANPQYGHMNMWFIRTAQVQNLDIKPLLHPEFDLGQLRQVFFGLQAGLNVESYAKPELNWEQMFHMREKLLLEAKKA